MHISLSFIRTFFALLSVFFITTYMTTTLGLSLANLFIGIVAGSLVGVLLIGMDTLFNRFNLRTFNIAMLGLLCGYLMGEAIMLVFSAIMDSAISSSTISILRLAVFLFTTYLGMVMTARAADEIYISIPFIKFKPTSHKKKDVLADISALSDSRIIDLATSGLLDHQLMIPRFIVKDMTAMLESSDETIKNKARKCLDTIKKLENIPTLDMRFAETDFPELKDPMVKLTKLARMLDVNIITADLSKVQQAQIEGVKIININLLANALKPVTQSGEYIHIKIQRYGKEPRQGVGYLEDGTMVVVNGGAEFIGATIKAQVLSVKHTTSGRMIFCNASEDEIGIQETEQSLADLENSHKNYFAI